MKDLFGGFCPGSSWLHELGLGRKYLLMLAPTLVAIFSGNWLVVGGCLAATGVLLLTTRLPLGRTLALPNPFWLLVAGLVAFHWWNGGLVLGLTTAATWVTAVWASRLITLTTPAPVLIDGLDEFLRPLAKFGVPVERISLAISLMIRSVPYLLGSFAVIRDAARARGLERSLWAQVAPVVIGAVAYAQRTGEAIAARDLIDG